MVDCPECLRKNACKVEIKNGKCINYTLDNISYAQHRLYRGILLPAITEAMGESNNQYVHDFILKPEWIYRTSGKYYINVNGYSEIPEKHQGSSRIINKAIKMYNQNDDEFFYKPEIIGYIPSMAKFTRAETKDYLKFCECILDEINGNIPVEHNQEYATLRSKMLK